MSFNTGSKLDPSQVEDVRGSRIGGRGLMVGGAGGIGVAIALAWVLLGGSPQTGETIGGLVDQTIGGGAEHPGPASSALAAECQTGADAKPARNPASSGTSTASRRTGGTSRRSGPNTPTKTRFFTEQIQTGCGLGVVRQRAVRLPGRPVVYIDLGFFDQLQVQIGGGAAVRRGLHARPRVRASCPGPGRRR